MRNHVFHHPESAPVKMTRITLRSRTELLKAYEHPLYETGI